MEKSLFTKCNISTGAAIMLIAGLAHAQSSVTLYGVADAGLLYTSKTANPATGQNAGKQFSLIDSGSTPSNFGLTGVEDLGGGLKAEFKLESGISLANGGFGISNGNFFGREAYVGLKSDLGELKAGVQLSPFFIAAYRLDPRGFSTFASSVIVYADNVAVTGVFNSNAVSYTSPVIAGFQGSVMYALGGEAGNFAAGRQYSGDLHYDNGTLLIDASFYNGNSGGTAQTPVPSTVEFFGRMLGAKYRFGTLSISASFASYKVAESFSSNVYGGGAEYYFTPTFNVNGGVWYSTDRNDSSNHSTMGAVGAQYFLSRATSAYVQVGLVNNHGKMDTGLSIDGALTGAPGTTVGALIGIRHTF